ncbi:MAG TPA: pilus assembly protein PilP [Candidatus Competibacteraceae bacterium]|nr:pilus assembly protein PilP [Candidatus Competibacteraceae bacterium]
MNTRFRPDFIRASGRGAWAVGAVLVILAGCAQQDLSEVQQFVEETKRTTPIKKPDPPPEIKPYTPFSYTAQGIKDPFVVSPFAQEEELELTQAGGGAPSSNYTGVRPDPNRVREELEKYSLGSLKMMGTFRMGGSDQLWALILAPDGVVHRVQKNNYLGTNHGKIINVTEQRVDLKEIVPDGPGRWQERDAFLSLTQ